MVEAELNIGECINFLYANKKARADLNKQEKDLKEQYEEVEQKLIHLIKAQGVNGLHANGVSATISEETYPGIEDFQAFEDYVIENRALFLLQRRISKAACDDLRNAGETIPGIKEFTKTSLSLRKR